MSAQDLRDAQRIVDDDGLSLGDKIRELEAIRRRESVTDADRREIDLPLGEFQARRFDFLPSDPGPRRAE